jgi:hypothetical protein
MLLMNVTLPACFMLRRSFLLDYWGLGGRYSVDYEVNAGEPERSSPRYEQSA